MEVAYIVEITKLMKCVTSREDPLIQIVRIYQTHHRLSIVTDRSLTRELQRGTRQPKDIIAEKTKKRIHGQFPRNLESELRLSHRRKTHIDG